ncbi:2,4-dienoyl-CoA reductase-like NADH-dependent reductase (Old Yellow Enzyme family) [Haloarcula quadrata]|uniref:2,4-dienoyl-CoA reductase-like NADH-dependent reductase (Old Yellow Enzyme family) n=1 Tax=Haloarcula quadrata TaxID=182779 RepID=A0A495R1D7_9EURY|nr:NADH:flavin oxidoreductase [Haloarcula quadrata]RKS81009.1 2,4-dienoyl-CoA reductase-like NADH-dependent reductase (Old Yellow Enzyme family) [Haloarcula quadrata]
MTALETPVSIGGVEVPNRLYRAPVLECAGNGETAVNTLIDELEPTAASGVGLLFQGASIVTDRGGCAAPNMTRVHDPAFVERLERLTGTIHDHGGRIFLQLAHGGLRSMATWHAEYRRQHPDQRQLAVSRPPWQLQMLDRLGLISLQPDVLSTEEVWALAEQFGRCAGYAVEAGYDGIHLSAANMSLIQQFLSPFYNRRNDQFRDGVRFLEAIHDAVREHAGDVPLVTKVPAETAAPSFVRQHLTRRDGVAIATRAAAIGYDGLVPVEVSPFWDMSIVRGAFPDRAWDASDLQDDYAAVFGGRLRARAVQLLNRLQARRFSRDPGWNAGFCRAVRERVDVPVLLEGGLRTRADCDRYLGATGATPAADAVGMARPFYAEPRLGARLLDGADALCESCNNCTIPQVTGEPGRCRTPAIVREQARLRRDGAYERTE